MKRIIAALLILTLLPGLCGCKNQSSGEEINYYYPRAEYQYNSADSILAGIGRVIAPIFAPLGFGDWRMVTALISGFSAKEAVVGTFGVVLGVGTNQLPVALHQLFTTLSAASFLAFTLLYTPCVAAVATIRRELDSTWKTVGVVLMQCMVAWVVALLVYQVGLLL